MTSPSHAVFVDLLRRHPGLIPLLLRGSRVVRIPKNCHFTVRDTCLDQLAPTEFRADLVLELRRRPGAKPWLLLVIEVQLQVDDDKLYSWPCYVTNLRSHSRTPACLVVVTPRASVAAWARASIDLGPGNEDFKVHVLGPEQLPVLTDPARVAENPSFAALSLLAHGRKSTAPVVAETLTRLAEVDRGDVLAYAHLIYAAIGAPLRRALHELIAMPSDRFPEIRPLPFLMPLYRKIAAREEARFEARGEAQGKAQALLLVLKSRGIALSPVQRRKIESCRDLKRLDRLLRRAAAVATADELFAVWRPRRATGSGSTRVRPAARTSRR